MDEYLGRKNMVTSKMVEEWDKLSTFLGNVFLIERFKWRLGVFMDRRKIGK